MEIPVGTEGYAQIVVTGEKTALAAGSGTLEVLATPMLAALMERACYTSIGPFLGEGKESVGTGLQLKHTSATPVGLKVWVESRVASVDGTRVTFHAEAFDEAGPIGGCTHTRAVVDRDRFLSGCGKKLGDRMYSAE